MKYLKVVSLVLVALLVASCAAQLPQKDIDAANAIMSEAEAAKATYMLLPSIRQL